MCKDKEYWSPGKLLITSEYVVIDGAKALAIPCKFGQDLKVEDNHTGIIDWMGKTNTGETWLTCQFDSKTLAVLSSNDSEKAYKLSKYLLSAKNLSSIFPTAGANIETNLDFPGDWGLGSSSTLLTNIAKWLAIDAFELHFAVSNGSGYDIACGLSKSPILYHATNQKASFSKVDFNPVFKDNIYFIHLNQKQISDSEVTRYSEIKKEIDSQAVVEKFTGLTEQILNANALETFEALLVEHENLMSHVLQRETIRESLFQMYSGGIIKSLGAWGGDFVMATAKHIGDLDYFKNKGFNTIIPYQHMTI